MGHSGSKDSEIEMLRGGGTLIKWRAGIYASNDPGSVIIATFPPPQDFKQRNGFLQGYLFDAELRDVLSKLDGEQTRRDMFMSKLTIILRRCRQYFEKSDEIMNAVLESIREIDWLNMENPPFYSEITEKTLMQYETDNYKSIDKSIMYLGNVINKTEEILQKLSKLWYDEIIKQNEADVSGRKASLRKLTTLLGEWDALSSNTKIKLEDARDYCARFLEKTLSVYDKHSAVVNDISNWLKMCEMAVANGAVADHLCLVFINFTSMYADKEMPIKYSSSKYKK